jgi:hypothetical protein
MERSGCVLLAVMLDLILAALGKQPDVSLVVERIPAYLQTLLLTAVIFGGQEEPGWRGFALPRRQQRHVPLILGLRWGRRSRWLGCGGLTTHIATAIQALPGGSGDCGHTLSFSGGTDAFPL